MLLSGNLGSTSIGPLLTKKIWVLSFLDQPDDSEFGLLVGMSYSFNFSASVMLWINGVDLLWFDLKLRGSLFGALTLSVKYKNQSSSLTVWANALKAKEALCSVYLFGFPSTFAFGIYQFFGIFKKIYVTFKNFVFKFERLAGISS